MKYPKGLLIFGFGGHARSVADIALDLGINEMWFIDGNAQEDEEYAGFPVRKEWGCNLPANWSVFSAAGDGATRHQHHLHIKKNGWPLATLIASNATLGHSCRVEEGAFIGRGAHIGPMASIGFGALINTGALIEHESSIGSYTHVSINAAVAGRSTVGSFCMIGAGAVVIDRVIITDNVTIGAGGVVTKNIDKAGTYVGVPVKKIDGNSHRN